MTLAIAPREGDTVVLDRLDERRPPFNPEDVAQDFAAILQRYYVRSVVGDTDAPHALTGHHRPVQHPW